jgi:hypothetical protein
MRARNKGRHLLLRKLRERIFSLQSLCSSTYPSNTDQTRRSRAVIYPSVFAGCPRYRTQLPPLDESLKGCIKTSMSVFPLTTFGVSIRECSVSRSRHHPYCPRLRHHGRRNGRRKLASSQSKDDRGGNPFLWVRVERSFHRRQTSRRGRREWIPSPSTPRPGPVVLLESEGLRATRGGAERGDIPLFTFSHARPGRSSHRGVCHATVSTNGACAPHGCMSELISYACAGLKTTSAKVPTLEHDDEQ